MQKTELMVLFKKMQRDDKKDVLKFEFKGSEDDPRDEKGNPTRITLPQSIYAMVGEMVNIEIEGTKCGPVTAELAKANKDSKKVVLDLNLKGDSSEKAIDLYRKAGQNVKLTIEPAQSSLLEIEDDPHEGIDYAVDITSGNVISINDKKKENEEIDVFLGDEKMDEDDLPY